MQRDQIGLVAAGVFLLAVAWIIAGAWSAEQHPITSFEECVAAGYPIMESYPRQCRAEGVTFVEQVAAAVRSIPGCVVAGCSSELCVESRESGRIFSDCRYEPSHACLQNFSVCERQENGHCGWTTSDALFACIADPASAIPEHETLEVI